MVRLNWLPGVGDGSSCMQNVLGCDGLSCPKLWRLASEPCRMLAGMGQMCSAKELHGVPLPFCRR